MTFYLLFSVVMLRFNPLL